jgi:hypothetical protein
MPSRNAQKANRPKQCAIQYPLEVTVMVAYIEGTQEYS